MEEQNEIFTEIKNLSYSELIDLRNQKIEQYKKQLEKVVNTDEDARDEQGHSIKGSNWWVSKRINDNIRFIDSKLLHKGKKKFNESLKTTLEKEMDLLMNSTKSIEESLKCVKKLRPMRIVSKKQDNSKEEKIAEVLKTNTDKLDSKELAEDNATFYYCNERGGLSLILDSENKYLAATSTIDFDKLYQEFKTGRRNGELK